MANKTKKISITSLEKALHDDGLLNNEEHLEWNGLDITVKKRLSLREVMSFVQYIVDNCVRKSDGEYLPEVLDFLINNGVIEYYTNISLPENSERRYDIVCACRPLINCIKQVIDGEQYDELCQAIRSKVYFEARTNIDAIIERAENTQAEVESVSSMLSKMLDDIDPDTFKNVIESIANNGIDEGKIMDAYMKHVEGDVNGDN